MYSISFLILISALCMVLYGSTDWSTVLADLQAQKALWSANGIIDYVFKQNTQCYCPACTVANKYVLIEDKIINTDGTPIYVEFDSTSSIGTDCEVTYPLDENYFNVTSYYDAAITFVQEKVDAGCDNGVSTNPFITCDGSITFNYDDTLYYPTLIYIEFNACGAACDAFISYNIDCLTAINTDDNTNIPPSYTNTCNDFTVPTSSSGEECPLRCESGFDGCNDCTCDGLGNFGGCTRRGCPDGTIAPAATCSMCEIGYEVNTVTNECESGKICIEYNICQLFYLI